MSVLLRVTNTQNQIPCVHQHTWPMNLILILINNIIMQWIICSFHNISKFAQKNWFEKRKQPNYTYSKQNNNTVSSCMWRHLRFFFPLRYTELIQVCKHEILLQVFCKIQFWVSCQHQNEQNLHFPEHTMDCDHGCHRLHSPAQHLWLKSNMFNYPSFNHAHVPKHTVPAPVQTYYRHSAVCEPMCALSWFTEILHFMPYCSDFHCCLNLPTLYCFFDHQTFCLLLFMIFVHLFVIIF